MKCEDYGKGGNFFLRWQPWSTVRLVEIGKFPEKQDKDPTMVPNETTSAPPAFHSCSIYVKAWFQELFFFSGGVQGGYNFVQDICLNKQQKHLQQRLSKVAVK